MKKNAKRNVKGSDITSLEKYLSKSMKDPTKRFIAQIRRLISRAARFDMNTALFMYMTGEALLDLKKVVENENIPWTEFIKQNFPMIHQDTLDRWMRIARHVEHEQCEVLCMLGYARLMRLVRVAEMSESQTVNKVLVERGIMLPLNTDMDNLAWFRKAVDDLFPAGTPPVPRRS